MRVVRIEAVHYGVEDLDACIRYFTDWGVACAERGEHGADFVLPSGQIIGLRHRDDPTLPAPVEGGSTAREVVWGVDTPRSLDEVAGELARDRSVTRDVDGTVHTTDLVGYPIAFRVTRPLEFDPAPPPFIKMQRARPNRIAHTVYHVPRSQAQAAGNFYLERLNFLLTDRILDLGDFVRAPGSRDHHNVFLVHKPNRIGFNHIAFEVSSFDEVLAGGEYMLSRGWKTAIEPGQHYLSSQRFWYFHCPAGGHTEYFTATMILDDSWTPRVVETSPG